MLPLTLMLRASLISAALAAPAALTAHGARQIEQVDDASVTESSVVFDLHAAAPPRTRTSPVVKHRRGVQAVQAAAPAPAAAAAEAASAPAKTIAAASTVSASTCAAPPAAAADGEGEAGAEGGVKEEEVLIDTAFNEIVELGGGDVKQDVLLPASSAGAFEVEFKSPNAAQLAVTENQTPAAPPAGFTAVESSSFIVQLAPAGGATLQKIDYFFDVENPAIAALDLATTKIGKLSADGCSFAIEDGELEFEAEENELTLTVADLNGEWGVFVPLAAGAAAAAAAGGAGGAAAANGTAVAAVTAGAKATTAITAAATVATTQAAASQASSAAR